MKHGSFEEEKKDCAMAGSLHKQGRRFNSRLKRHYVVKNGEMLYYNDASDSSPKKVLSLRGCKAMIMTAKGDASKQGIVLQTIKRTHRLFVDGEAEAESWIDAILRTAKRGSMTKKGKITHNDVMELAQEMLIPANKVEELYELHEELGTGGFSVVRRGVHLETKNQWALKLVRNSVYQKNKERTDEEVGLLVALDHPGIVKLKEVVQTPRYFCIVLELLTGGELFDRIVQREKYSENDAKKVAIAILEILAHMHDKNIVHRDLKPENLLFDRPGDDAQLRLTDFGFATVVEKHRPLTASCGTPEYVAPEILEEKPYGVEVDMWSAGVIIYILLCGFPPFYADNEQELFDKICRADFKFLSPYWNKISWEAKDLIANLLTIDTKKRLTAKEALEHRWLEDVGKGASGGQDDSVDLGGALDELKRYNATRKFRKTILAVLATNKMKVWAEMEEDCEP